MMSIAPQISCLRSFTAANLSWAEALGELIDNAFDAGAKNVAITFASRSFEISDDGRGTSNILNIITLGGREDHTSTELGTYGIGAKDAVLWIGGATSSRITVRSTHGDITRQLAVKWDEIPADWEIPAPSEGKADPRDIGTNITISTIRKPPEAQRIIEKLGYLYSPGLGLGEGRTIKMVIGRQQFPVHPWSPPELLHRLDTEVVVKGKTAKISVGVTPEGYDNKRRGLTYTRGFRVIKENSDDGCGDYSVLRVCGVVKLDSKWRLLKNKNGIVDHADELYSAVEEAIRPVLEKAGSMSEMLMSAAFEREVSNLLNQMMGLPSTDPNDKAKRCSDGGEKGTKNPTGKGGKHTRAERKQSGSTFDASASGYKVTWDTMADGRAGDVTKREIILNINLPLIRRAKDDGNIVASASQAFALLAGDKTAKGMLHRNAVPEEDRNFNRIFGKFLGTEASLGGQQTAPRLNVSDEKRGLA